MAVVFLCSTGIGMIPGWLERRDCLRVYGHPCNIWEDAAMQSPLKPRPHAGAGYLAMQHGRYNEALHEFGTAHDLAFLPGMNPHEAEVSRLNAELNIATILQRTHHDAEARTYLIHAWNRTPGFPGFAVGLSYYAIQDGAIDMAGSILDDGIEGLHRWPQLEQQFGGALYLNRGAVFEIQGDCIRANTAYRQASRYPGTPVTQCN